MSDFRTQVREAVGQFDRLLDQLEELVVLEVLDDEEADEVTHIGGLIACLYHKFTDRAIAKIATEQPEEVREAVQNIPGGLGEVETIKARVINRLRATGAEVDPGVLLATLGKNDPIN